MTISLRTMLLVALASGLALAAFLVFDPTGRDAPTGRAVKPVFAPPASPVADPPATPPARAVPEEPIATVGGSTPGTKLTLLSLRRTGPKVVSARLRITFDAPDPEMQSAWIPSLVDGGLSAEDMRLVDEVNGREHFVLRNSDGECLCTGPFAIVDDGQSSVISAKFPAPPENVTHASLETPGFASFDAVPLS